jgi:hypothetical protein
MIPTTRTYESPTPTPLLLAFELGERSWKLGFSVGPGPTSPSASNARGCGRSPVERDCPG